MPPTTRSRPKKSSTPAADRGTVVITALSLLLACLGIAISVVGTFTDETPPAAESVER